MRSSPNRVDALFLALAALVVAVYVAAAGGGFPLDDAWIHQTYARNLALTGQWAFVPGQPSAASTSPLYTVLLALGYRLGLPHALWTHVLGAVALTAAAMLGARMVRHVSGSPRLALVTGLTLIFTWHLIWAAASGMETMLFSALTLALLWLGWRELDEGWTHSRSPWVRGAAFGALSALALLARPEGIVLAGLIALALLLARPPDFAAHAGRWIVAAALAFVVVAAPYLAYNFQVTGGFLPDTAAAKQAEYAPLLAQPYTVRFGRLLAALAPGVQLVLLPGALAFAVVVWRRGPSRQVMACLLPLLWPVALVALYAARLPADYQHGRYVIPALPAFLVCGVAGTGWLLNRRWPLLPRVAVRALAISAVVIAAWFALVIGPRVYAQDVRVIDEEMVASARWIAEHLPPADLLAVHDIGALGYFAPRPILDLAGLVSPEVVPIIRDSDALWALLRARDARYLMAFPDQIPGQNPDDPRLCPVYTTGGVTSPSLGGPNMTVYQLAWDAICPEPD